jgi:hypothetical protein
VPKTQIVLGAGFFGSNQSGDTEWSYSDIMKADSSGLEQGLDDGQRPDRQLHRHGVDEEARRLLQRLRRHHVLGIVRGHDRRSHSLYKVIQGEF